MDRPLQPRPRTRSTDRRAGFTLIEVVAVMMIIALVASLAVTMMPGTGRGGLKALTLEMIERAREFARTWLVETIGCTAQLDEEPIPISESGGPPEVTAAASWRPEGSEPPCVVPTC